MYLPFAEAAQRVKDQLDMLDIVRRTVVLKRTGKNYVGLCPFHPDKRPSMTVSPDKGLFKCFSCGAGGDTLTFYMRHHNVGYREAIETLAGEMGIAIAANTDDPAAAARAQEKRDSKTELYQWFESTTQFYSAQLGSDTCPAKAYLAKRNISPETIARFRLGHAPAGWETTLRFLKTTFPDSEWHQRPGETGLLSVRESADGQGQRVYDRFRDRLIIPILDERGRPIAFGGRTLDPHGEPKYLNSSETMLYNKSEVLFGLAQARDSIRQERYAIVMEGYFDVIRAHQAGIPQAIGTCGTALTEQHFKRLLRFELDTLYLAFDADAAGLRAALGGIERMMPHLPYTSLAVRIVTVPNGKDPDDFIAQHGRDAFLALLDTAPDHWEFQMMQAMAGHALDTAPGRIAAATAITPILAAIPNVIALREKVTLMADRLSIRTDDLLAEIQRYRKHHNKNDTRANAGQGAANGYVPAPYGPQRARTQANAPYQSFSKTRRAQPSPPPPPIPASTSPPVGFTDAPRGLSPNQQRLLKRVAALEARIMTLAFAHEQTFAGIFPVLHQVPFTATATQQVVTALQQSATALDTGTPFTLTLAVAHIQHQFSGDTQIQQAFAHWMLEGESILATERQRAGLATDPNPDSAAMGALIASLLQSAQQCIEELIPLARQMAGMTLNQSMRNAADEADQVALQYQLRDSVLGAGKRPSTTTR